MKTNLTEIIFLLDRSGSMAGLEADTIGGFNGFVKKQHGLGETLITTVLFDNQYELLHNGVPAETAVLTNKEYFTRGTTALLDAVGKTILDVGNRLSHTPEDDRPEKVIFVITTDGMENASREFSYPKVTEMITRQKDIYGWEFIFMGANIDSSAVGAKIGLSEEACFKYKASRKGTQAMFNAVCECVGDMRETK